MRRGLSRWSGTGAHGLRQEAGGAGLVQLGEEQSVVGSSCCPADGHGEGGRWQQPFPRRFDKMENERTRGKGCKSQQRIVPKQVKGNIFRIRAVKYLSKLQRKVVDTAPSNPS